MMADLELGQLDNSLPSSFILRLDRELQRSIGIVGGPHSIFAENLRSIGKVLIELLPEELCAAICATVGRSLASEQPCTEEGSFKTRDGQSVLYRLVIAPLDRGNDEVDYAFGTLTCNVEPENLVTQ